MNRFFVMCLYILVLKASGSINASSLINVGTAFKFSGPSAGSYFGNSTSSAGDLNKDGYDDLIIGARSENSITGAAYIIFGGPLASFSNFNVAGMSNTQGFKITGALSDSGFGTAVSPVGDFNKDGY